MVGVAGDVRSRGLGEAPPGVLAADRPGAGGILGLDPANGVLARALRIRRRWHPVRGRPEVAPGVPLYRCAHGEADAGVAGDRALQHHAADAPRRRRPGALGVGIYGVIAYFVTRRTPEIGVRMALGAHQAHVVALVFRQAAWPVAIGIVLGVAVAVAAHARAGDAALRGQRLRSDDVSPRSS